MIRRRLNYLGFFMRLATLLLPLLAFAVAAYVRFASGLIPLLDWEVDPADYFADRTARSLEQGLVPCAIAAFIRLPGQDVAVTEGPVIELGAVPQFISSAEIDDVIVALPPARLGEIPALMTLLEPFCLPVR